jgi:tetratricopeptide (TPR) repeat protein
MSAPDKLTRTRATADPGATNSFADAGVTATCGASTAAGAGTITNSTPTAGRYVLGAEISRGGMGAVYSAVDTALNREVAVKVLQGRFDPGSAAVRRFEDEARITGQLQHPAIPPVHDRGTLPDGRPFLAMKLIKGRTLAAVLADGSMSRSALVAAFEQVCQAVAYAHNHGVIHRDLKPSNIMVGSFAEVQVVDWGLAKFRAGARTETVEATEASTFHDPRADREDPNTQAGSILGTPAFMAPEQAIGAVELIDERADVFGLGAVLSVILTGEPPFVGGTAESTRQLAAQGKLGAAFARLDGCSAEPELVALCKRCLGPERGERPRNAGEVAEAIREFRFRSEERARRAELDRARAHVQAAEQRKRRKVQLALALAVLGIVAGGGAFAWWDQKVRTDRAEIEGRRLRAEAEVERQEQVVRERVAAGRAAATALLDRAERALNDGDAERAEVALTEAGRRITEGGIDDLRPRLDRCRGEHAVLRELDDIDNDRGTYTGGKLPAWETIAPRWARVFSGYGISPGATSPTEVARRINGALIRERLLTSLEVWFVLTRDEWLRRVLSAADPDAFRDEARATSFERAFFYWAFNGKPVPPLQPLWFAIAHGGEGGPAHGPREGLLLTAHRSRPGNFPLLMALGNQRTRGDRESAFRSVSWYRAALALQPRNVIAWGNLGNALRDIGDLSGAVAACREAVHLDPENARAQTNLGVALKESGDLTSAIAASREAIRLDPQFATGYSNLGIALLESGDRPGALTACDQAVRLDAKYALHHYNLGVARHVNGDVPGAVAAFKEAIQIDPTYAEAHYNLGIALHATGDLPGAITACKDAVRFGPKRAHAHDNLGIVLLEFGDRTGAVTASREAVRLDPKNPKYHTSVGTALFAAGDVSGAKAAFREAITCDPAYTQAHFNLGVVLHAAGDESGAVAAFREAVRLDPKYVDAHLNLGSGLYNLRDMPGAIAAFRDVIRLDPKKAAAHSSLGIALLATGDMPGAVEACREAVRLDPKDPGVHNNLGLTLMAGRALPDAIAAFQEAVRLNPKSATAHHNLGLALKESGDPLGAIPAYREAVRLDPKLARAHYNLGVALHVTGDVPGAISAFKESIRLEPKFAPAHNNLGASYLKLQRYAEAIACARDAIEADPKYANAHALLGDLLLRTGDTTGARAALTEAARLDRRWLGALEKLPHVAPPPRPRW